MEIGCGYFHAGTTRSKMTQWDSVTDLVVVGSGAGGMTTALVAKKEGLDALVLEKTEFYGGSTAISVGGIWAPGNHLMARERIEDSRSMALDYLQNTVGDRTPKKKGRPSLIGCRR